MPDPSAHDPGPPRGDDAAGGPWLVVNTHTHKERLAVEHLERQGFPCYCPMVRTRVRHARRTHEVLRPLFPGYLFVAVDPGRERWRPILSTVGVRGLVRSGEVPGRLDDGFVRSLKAREIAGAIERPAAPFAVGQAVTLRGGAFDGVVARIVALEPKDRLVVLFELLNRPVTKRLDVTEVQGP